MLAKHGAGAAINDIAAEMGVKPQRVRRVVEGIGPRHADGRALLAIDPEDIEGLRLTAALSQRAYAALANATYHIDVPDLDRLGEVAAQGRECVAHFPGIGPGIKTELDKLLDQFGLTWNPRPRRFVVRTEKNMHPVMAQMREQMAKQKQQEARSSGVDYNAFYQIGRLQGSAHVIEDELGLPHPPEHGSRAGESSEAYCVRMLDDLRKRVEVLKRFAFSSSAKRIDDEDDPADHLERSGNLICLPGVKLAEVEQEEGGLS